jgi:integrase
VSKRVPSKADIDFATLCETQRGKLSPAKFDAWFTTQCDAAKPRETPYKLSYAKGLSLLVTPQGGKHWRLRFRHGAIKTRDSDGRERVTSREGMISLGSFPEIDLATAIERRDANRTDIAKGVNPTAKKRAEKWALADSFEAVAREWLERQKPGLAPITYARAEWTFEKLVFPRLGGRPIGKIKATDVLDVLRPIEAKENFVTARRTLQRIASVIQYAIPTERATVDVTVGLVKQLTKLPKAKKHAAITKASEIGQLLRAIDGYKGHGVTLYALKLAPLLFVRPGELRHMEWAELELDGKHPQWRIPPEKMKMRRPHLVPLAKQAVVLLRELRAITGPTPKRAAKYVFPAMTSRARPMSENTENTALRRLGYSNTEMTAHGFRSMASTQLNEGFDGHVFNKDWIEKQLAHDDEDSQRSDYNEAEYLPQRRQMMQVWADHLDKLRAETDEPA